MPVAGNENVLGFEVTVDNPCSMETFNALDYLGGVEPSAIAPKTAPAGELGSKISTWVEVLFIWDE